MHCQFLRSLLPQKDFLPPAAKIKQLSPLTRPQASVSQQTPLEMVGEGEVQVIST
jgi:hypothetical protein